LSCKCDLNAKLEAERFDVTFREPKRLVEVETVTRPCTRNHATPAESCKRQHVTETELEERDTMMFNAGRYAAGARDKSAVVATEKMFESFDK